MYVLYMLYSYDYMCTVFTLADLEYVGQVPEVEDVVKLDSSWEECCCHLHTDAQQA